ncbi:MAG: hypothetical protein IT306_09835 [Chloroflexi bacterium]|nr:hypothetical protein [Chloroflexota bacterium]
MNAIGIAATIYSARTPDQIRAEGEAIVRGYASLAVRGYASLAGHAQSRVNRRPG